MTSKYKIKIEDLMTPDQRLERIEREISYIYIAVLILAASVIINILCGCTGGDGAGAHILSPNSVSSTAASPRALTLTVVPVLAEPEMPHGETIALRRELQEGEARESTTGRGEFVVPSDSRGGGQTFLLPDFF